MNAKKIMGAVLVALLAAALFVGAGAAADEEAAGTVFLYEANAQLPAGIATGVYSYGDASVEVGSTGVLPLNIEKFVDGAKYSNGTHYIVVKLPNAGFTAVGGDTGFQYDAMANGLIEDQPVTFTATPVVSGTGAKVVAIIIYDENGVPTRTSVDADENGVATLTNPTLTKGTYQIQAVLGTAGDAFVQTVEGTQLYGQKYSFTVYSTVPTLTASADSVIVNNFITVTITGEPGEVYTLDAEDFTIEPRKQLVPVGEDEEDGAPIYAVNGGAATIKLPNSGKLVVYLKATDDDGKKNIVLKLDGVKKASASVTIVKGAITAVADEDSYFIGNPIGLSGTTTAGSELYFYIEGTNFQFTSIDDCTTDDGDLDVVGEDWTVEFDSQEIKYTDNTKKLVAGTYTIVVSIASEDNYESAKAAGTFTGTLKDYVMDTVYATATVTMTQPFLTGIEAANTAIQDTDYEITGIAYAAEQVRLYVFGTNFFTAAKADVEDDETFKFTLKDDVTNGMAPGTYFYLIQHPMNDGLFNVFNGTGFGHYGEEGIDYSEYDADFFYGATFQDNGQVELGQIQFIFNAWERGTNYAAQALLNEISGQNIDDIFVQGTFEVAAQKLTINPIPAEVVKGNKLIVSGTSNSGEGVEVIVNVLAGKFGATVKGDENSATFLTAKAVTKEDGTFEAAIDTSKLETGSYIVTVELNGQMYDSAAVEIVEKAPVTPPADDKPDTPVTPPADDKPTEPETPGFGALAALAGLGAVAVLLLRRE